MSAFTPINLSGIPAPAVVEALDFETILAAMVADLQARDTTFTALLESDPALKILEVCAYRELLLRQRVNDAAKGVMLTYALGTDLENLGAFFGVTRNTITPANPNVYPPIPAVYETDESLRYRITLALEGLSTAGPFGSYVFHALKTATIKDVAVAGPPEVEPGNVRVTLLSHTGNGTASAGEVAAVFKALNAEDVRPLTDIVTVQAASVLSYKLAVQLSVYDGPDPEVLKAEALARLQAYAAAAHKIGQDIRAAGVIAAAFVSGVENVALLNTGGALTADLTVSSVQAAYCTGITVTTVPATP
jgi:phage-related baseplate assembly protein